MRDGQDECFTVPPVQQTDDASYVYAKREPYMYVLLTPVVLIAAYHEKCSLGSKRLCQTTKRI